MKEIERKFLVQGEFPKDGVESVGIIQGYICSQKEHVVRIRIEGTKAYLAIKGPDKEGGFSHLEIEKKLSLEEGMNLLEICEPGIIRKKRYFVPERNGNHTFDVDVFEGNNKGLVLAEIELESEEEPFNKPEWLGKEVTADYRYSNISLQKKEQQSVGKKIVYIDMDGVLVDFQSGVDKAEPYFKERFKKNPDYIPGVFNLMEPMPGAKEAVNQLADKYDLYILSTASWNNPLCWMEKRQWVGKHFGEQFHKRLILTHHKELNKGDYLIDDRDRNGAAEFEGELIQFGSARYPDWQAVVRYLLGK